MDSSLDPYGSRASRCALVVVRIIDGKPWNASKLRDNNLRQHCRALGKSFRPDRADLQRIRPPARRLLAVLAQHPAIFSARHPDQFPLIPFVLRLAAYFIYWRRQPEDWRPHPAMPVEDYWRSLLDHLLCAGHAPPPGFARAWLLPGPLVHRERTWYCHIASGKGLRKAPGLPEAISQKAIHHAMLEAPAAYGLAKALRWGQMWALGAGADPAQAVLNSGMAKDFANDKLIWLPLLGKILAAPGFQPEAFGPLADMFQHELASEGPDHTARLLSAPLSELRRRARRLWRDLLDLYQRDGGKFRAPAIQRAGVRRILSVLANRRWEAMADTELHEIWESGGRRWNVVQLTCHLQLVREGDRMGNCVSWYWRRCWAGKSAIFSMRQFVVKSGKIHPTITLEVDRATRRVVQAERRWNRDIQAADAPVVKAWAARHRLTMDV